MTLLFPFPVRFTTSADAADAGGGGAPRRLGRAVGTDADEVARLGGEVARLGGEEVRLGGEEVLLGEAARLGGEEVRLGGEEVLLGGGAAAHSQSLRRSFPMFSGSRTLRRM